MEDTVKSIDSQIVALRKRRREIEDKTFKERALPNLRKMLGKTLVYRNNSYSCPEKPSDYWDVYRKVIAVVEKQGGVWLVFEECSIDKDGKASLSTDSSFRNDADNKTGWVSCSSQEYEKVREEVVAAIESPNAYERYLAAD